MTQKLQIEKTGDWEFHVRIVQGDTQSSHTVYIKPADYTRITAGKLSADELVRASFEFLLGREPAESILGRFDLSVISRYFPEYEREMDKRLSKNKKA